jgi:hypothetical protein
MTAEFDVFTIVFMGSGSAASPRPGTTHLCKEWDS